MLCEFSTVLQETVLYCGFRDTEGMFEIVVQQVFSALLPTAREGYVFTGVCHSVHNQPHGYSVTAHHCYSAVGTHPTGMISCCHICIHFGSRWHRSDLVLS